ncbi:ATP-binding protein [Streptosporangium oxazolinicum]|uniref:ATP-binding protein n=1 Tax=Streptosporangium oxazolinicum TaxID=909287 RepID=UPI0031E9ED16
MTIARQCAAAVLESEGVPVDDCVLIISELVTNAVRHTASGHPNGTVILMISDAGPMVRVEVIDAGAPTVPMPRQPSEDADSGRGLFLVDRLSVMWGVRKLYTGGRAVWAMIERGKGD